MLYQQFHFDKRGEFESKESPTVFEPIFTYNNNQLKCRYLRDYINDGQMIQNTPLSKEQNEALDIFDKIIHDENLVVSYKLRQNEMVFFNNNRVLHGRTSFEDFERIYKVNVFGVSELIRQLFPYFNEKSHIINISSIGGISGSNKFSGLSAYSSSKGALNILTEMLAEEFKDTGIRVNTLALGAVQTEMLEEAFPGYKANISPIEMADFIYKFSLEGNSFFNGKIIPVSITNP